MYKIQPRHADASIADRLASSQSNARVNKNIYTLRRIFNLAIGQESIYPKAKTHSLS